MCCGFFMFGEYPLLRRNRTHHPACLGTWRAFDFSVFGELGDNGLHDLAPFFYMCQLAAAEHHGHLDFVLVVEKTDSLFDLEIDIVFARLGPHSDFLELGLVRFVFVVFLVPLVTELAVVHDPANWRFGFGCHLYEIHPGFAGLVHRIFCWNYA